MILINNTVLSNFALAQAVPLLMEFCGGKGRVTEQVLAEFEKGVQQGVLPTTTLNWLKRVKLIDILGDNGDLAQVTIQ